MVRIAAALAGLAFAASGCGTTTIDAGKAEKFVTSALPAGAQQVHCPSGVKAKTGHTLTCTALLADGKRYDITLHVVSGPRVQLRPSDIRPAP